MLESEKSKRIHVGRISLDQIIKLIKYLGSFCSTFENMESWPQIVIDYPEGHGLLQRPFSRGGPDFLVAIYADPETKEQIEKFVESYFTNKEKTNGL